ncbi:MAG: type I-E CRISPR-associated protein Cas6/Cse3/CasE [Anaerolineales bacterium]
MFLSRLMLNLRHKRTQSELARPYELHRTVMSAFPAVLPAEERVLFRPELDERLGTLRVIVQSQTEPDWRRLLAVPGYLQCSPESKTVALALSAGQVLAFRLRANPTTKKDSHQRPDDHREYPNGVRLGIADEDGQRRWLDRKGEQHGFRVLQVQVRPQGLQRSYKSEQQAGGQPRVYAMSHLAVQFDGLLQVTDPQLFGLAVHDGIGSAKSLGFGLLSLAPPQLAYDR